MLQPFRRCCSTFLPATIPGVGIQDHPPPKPLYIKPEASKDVGFVRPARPAPKRLPPLPSMSDLLKIYRVKALRHMSQNFLFNPRVCDRFVGSTRVKEGDYVVEIGPGPGPLTRKILDRNPKTLFVIEKDRRFLPMMEQLADAVTPGQMKIVLGDILDFTLADIFPQELKRDWNFTHDNIKIIANLPFSVSIPLLIKWLRQMSTKSGLFAYGRIPLTLSFQHEVAERLRAYEMSRSRSRISIITQTFCKVDYRFTIRGKSFHPTPKVDAGVVTLTPLKESWLPEGMDFKSYEKFVMCFVHHRRLPLDKNLKLLFPPDKQHLIEEVCKGSSYKPWDYPLMLSVEEIAFLAKNWWNLCQEFPGLIDYDYRARKKPPRILKEMFQEGMTPKKFKQGRLEKLAAFDQQLEETNRLGET